MQEIQFWRSFLQEYRKTKDMKQTRSLLLSFMLAETQKDDRIDLRRKGLNSPPQFCSVFWIRIVLSTPTLPLRLVQFKLKIHIKFCMLLPFG